MGLGSELDRICGSLLRALIKGLDAKDPEVRAARERVLTEAIKRAKLATPADAPARLAAAIAGDDATAAKPAVGLAEADPESKPRLPGTRWLPPAQVAGPVLAVHLDRPDRLAADYRREGARKVVLSEQLTENNAAE